jgi:transposase
MECSEVMKRIVIHRVWRWIMRFDLSDDEWALLEPLMPRSRKSGRVDDRRVMNAIFYVLRTGMPWRDLPERYGPYTTVYNRFNRWSRRGIWQRVFAKLAARSRDSLYLIDSTVVKAHRAASGAKGGSKIRRSVSAGAAEPPKSTRQSIAKAAH